MLTKTEKLFTAIYALLVTAELICTNIDRLADFHFVTKPAIVVSLLIFFFMKSTHLNTTTKLVMVLALLFSLIGDVALLFDAVNPTYFILGLASFLIAHVMYILVFLRLVTLP